MDAPHFIDESRAFRRRLPCVTLCLSAYLEPLHVAVVHTAVLHKKRSHSVGIVLGQFAIVLGFTSTVPILEYYTAVH